MSEYEKTEEAVVSDQRDDVPIEFPARMEEMLEQFFKHRGEVVGSCLLCNRPIRAENDFIANTNTHDCERGRAIHPSAKEHEVEDETDDGQDEPAELLRDLALGRRCRVRHRCR